MGSVVRMEAVGLNIALKTGVTKLMPDGMLICMTGAGVEAVDPVSGDRLLLIEEPVSNISN